MRFTDKLQTRYSDYDRYNRLYPESILKLFEAVAERRMHSIIGDSVVKGDVSWLITDWRLEVERYPEREEGESGAGQTGVDYAARKNPIRWTGSSS